MTIDEMLEARHTTWLQWCEPWPAVGPEGNELHANIVMQATVHDCINLSRKVSQAAGRPTQGDDANHLLDFIAVHWAKLVESLAPSTSATKPYLVEDVSVGELVRLIDHLHLNAARETPPNRDYMRALQRMADEVESALELYMANDKPT